MAWHPVALASTLWKEKRHGRDSLREHQKRTERKLEDVGDGSEEAEEKEKWNENKKRIYSSLITFYRCLFLFYFTSLPLPMPLLQSVFLILSSEVNLYSRRISPYKFHEKWEKEYVFTSHYTWRPSLHIIMF